MGDEQFPVEHLHVLTFARAIGDENPSFSDREAARAAGLDDIAAPLTFDQASAHCDPDYPLRPRPRESWFSSGREPGTRHPELNRTLHAEQHFEYHRPLVVGDVLTWHGIPGETWIKQGRSGGVLEFREFRTEYRDAKGKRRHPVCPRVRRMLQGAGVAGRRTHRPDGIHRSHGRGGTEIELSLNTRNQDEVEVFSGTTSAHLEDTTKEQAT